MDLKSTLGQAWRGFRGIIHLLTERVPAPAPDIESFSIGHSAGGRNITCYKIGTGSTPVLLGAAIHGNEQGSARFAYRLLEWITRHAPDFPNLTVYIIAVLNPDGYAEAQKHPGFRRGGLVGRFNARGVDLNRNFPTPSFRPKSTWGRGKDYAEKISVDCGEHGGSEPETQALMRFIADKDIRFYFAFHNAAGAVLGNSLPEAQKASGTFSDASGYSWESEQEWRTLGQTGTGKEWFELQHIPYLEIEGRYRWGSDWRRQLAGMRTVFRSL